jgi:hypothetical protein
MTPGGSGQCGIQDRLISPEKWPMNSMCARQGVRMLPVLAAVAALTLASGCPVQPDVVCSEPDADATMHAAGTFRFGGSADEGPAAGGLLTGTITFEQEGEILMIVKTTYDYSSDRALVGQGVLVGNRAETVLVPENGDLDYVAHVTFVFSDDGNSFCVEFEDTNGDAGDPGSYTGIRL